MTLILSNLKLCLTANTSCKENEKKTYHRKEMPSYEESLKEIEKLVDQLVDAASKLLDSARQAFSEEDLVSLQKKQDELFKRLLKADQAYHETFPDLDETKIPAAKRVSEKLTKFQQLNLQFIETLRSDHGLIHFDPKQENTHT